MTSVGNRLIAVHHHQSLNILVKSINHSQELRKQKSTKKKAKLTFCCQTIIPVYTDSLVILPPSIILFIPRRAPLQIVMTTRKARINYHTIHIVRAGSDFDTFFVSADRVYCFVWVLGQNTASVGILKVMDKIRLRMSRLRMK